MSPGATRTGSSIADRCAAMTPQAGFGAGAALAAAFLAVYLWQLGTFFRRNRPGRYRPEAIPAAVLPGG